MSRRLLVSILAACALLSLPARADSVNRDGLIREVLALSGILEQVRNLPAQEIEGIEADRERLGAEKADQLRKAVEEAYDPEFLRTSMASFMQRSFDEQQARAALAWLRSPLGVRITHLEIEADTPEGSRRINAYGSEMLRHPPTQIRADLINRLMESSGVGEEGAEVAVAFYTGFIGAMQNVLPEEQRVSSEDLARKMAAMKQQMTKAEGEAQVFAHYYIYRNLSDEELSRYVAFAESPAGRWSHRAIHRALVATITQASARMAEGFSKAAQCKPPDRTL